MIFLRTKTEILMFLLSILICGSWSTDTEEEEEEKLNEALLLVNLLKSEYVKVLRENILLRNGGDQIVTEDLSTCATTERTNDTSFSMVSATPSPLPTLTSLNSSGTTPRDSTGASLQHSDALRQPQQQSFNGTNPYRNFRRNFPAGYHNYATNSNTTPTKAKESDDHTKSSKTTIIPKKLVSVTSKNRYRRARIQQFSFMLNQSSERAHKDPIMSQVASELINEFEEEVKTEKSKTYLLSKTTKSKPIVRTTNKYMGISPKLKNKRNMYKTSLKIHLSRSSRFPIPLPENNAFCYSNPESALCRTP